MVTALGGGKRKGHNIWMGVVFVHGVGVNAIMDAAIALHDAVDTCRSML